MMGLIVTVIVVGIASSFAPNYPLFLTSVFINGFSALGSGTVMYCWMMELLAGKAKVLNSTEATWPFSQDYCRSTSSNLLFLWSLIFIADNFWCGAPFKLRHLRLGCLRSGLPSPRLEAHATGIQRPSCPTPIGLLGHSRVATVSKMKKIFFGGDWKLS